ncbi:MAG: pyridoxamine 5'-phosphate oxidase family protein [bacterium]
MAIPRTQVRRIPKRGANDRATLDAILDEGIVCHVGFVEGASPVVIPTGYVRDGDRLLLHGSTASRLMQHLAAGKEVCITVTLLDAVVLARSAFHHSMNYRSAVLFGKARRLPDETKNDVLAVYVERLLPGRWDTIRLPNAKELSGTVVVEFPIDEFSCKSRTGPPGDEPEDMDFPVWAGIVPVPTVVQPATQDPQQKAMPTPPTVAAWRPNHRK